MGKASWWTFGAGTPEPGNVSTAEENDQTQGPSDVLRSTSLRMDVSPGDRYNSPRQDQFSTPVALQHVRGYTPERVGTTTVGLTSQGAQIALPSRSLWDKIRPSSFFLYLQPIRWSSAATPATLAKGEGQRGDVGDYVTAVFYNPIGGPHNTPTATIGRRTGGPSPSDVH